MPSWKKFWKKWGKIKDPIWINDLPEEYRSNVRRVRSLLVMIGDNWVLYPLWTFITIAMSLILLMMHTGTEIPDPDYNQWKVGIGTGSIICLLGLPLSKLVFLKRCKRLLSDLHKEIAGENGWWAYKLIREKESSLTQVAKSASRRNFLDWFSLMYHYINLDNETKRMRKI